MLVFAHVCAHHGVSQLSGVPRWTGLKNALLAGCDSTTAAAAASAAAGGEGWCAWHHAHHVVLITYCAASLGPLTSCDSTIMAVAGEVELMSSCRAAKRA